MTKADIRNQLQLKKVLQQAPPGILESLATRLLGELLGVTIASATSGFQHGGDAGPAGRQGRRFRIECKRYGDGTGLRGRELLGEIVQALDSDEALEAWILVTTREVREQDEGHLYRHSERIGVPVIVLDWKPDGVASVAALCASAPEIVGELVSTEAKDLSRSLRECSDHALGRIKRELHAWCLGRKSLETASHDYLNCIWNEPSTATAQFGQDAAGGAKICRVRRRAIDGALDAWWEDAAKVSAPLLLLGLEGVGKTWCALDWLTKRIDSQPVVIVVPSSAAAGLNGTSVQAMKQFLAACLLEISGVRDQTHWLRRLDRLLQTPPEEGPVITLLLDGMNQEPTVRWKDVLALFQASPFEGRVRVIASTRIHHFSDRLQHLGNLLTPAVVVRVEGYDDELGGELDQMLAHEGLTRAGLHPELLAMARNPRLFALVVKFKDRLMDAGKITPHLLLWEYGRDSLENRTGRPFSEDEWKAWLRKVAHDYREGVRVYTTEKIMEMTGRGDLGPDEVYARLSTVVDGHFVTRDADGEFRLDPVVVAHALAVLLLKNLADPRFRSREELEVEIDKWLDPFSGMDMRGEVLRAAVSIFAGSGRALASAAGSVLLTAWLQTQNLPENHRDDVARLASELVGPLLDAIEHSPGRGRTSARRCAIDALGRLPREPDLLQSIVRHAYKWFLRIPRDVEMGPHRSAEAEDRRAKRLVALVGSDSSGPRTILGHEVVFCDNDFGDPSEAIPVLLEGFPLERATSVFEAAALRLAIRNRCDEWTDLGWLCLLNPLDGPSVVSAFRRRAAQLAELSPEEGIDEKLSLRIAAMLLGLSREEVDEPFKAKLGLRIGRPFSYEADYLNNPSLSTFALEWRHGSQALLDKSLRIEIRLHRTKRMWLDPDFIPPAEFVKELNEYAAEFPVDELACRRERTSRDYDFEEYEPILARSNPSLLAQLVRRKLEGFATRSSDAGYWGSIQATDHWILADRIAALAARELRLKGLDPDLKDRWVAQNALLILELNGESGIRQYAGFIDADVEYFDLDICDILKPLSKNEIDELIRHYGGGSPKQVGDLVVLLACHASPMNTEAWNWLEKLAFDESFNMRDMAFETLCRSNPVRFGCRLHELNWAWKADCATQRNHHGSKALIAATSGVEFEHVAPRLAPWLVPAAARERGCLDEEVTLAAMLIGAALGAGPAEAPDLGSDAIADTERAAESPFALSIRLREDPTVAEDPNSAWRASLDFEAQEAARRQAADIALERIRAARKAGAGLFLMGMNAADFKPLLVREMSVVRTWLEGMRECSSAFVRRVRLAEGAYLALCEALLELDPPTGAELWRSLRKTLVTRWIGKAKIDEMIHIAFRVQQSPACEGILHELFELGNAHTDMHLFELATAALVNRRSEFIATMIAADAASGITWRQRRATVLTGFSTENILPVEGAWPEGILIDGSERLAREASQFRHREACSRHWWEAFLRAPNAELAYAAWILFLRTADRRSWTWLSDSRNSGDGTTLWNEKWQFVQLNEQLLKRALHKRDDKLEECFLGLKIGEQIRPWSSR